MEELRINDDLAREVFVGAFKESNLVPILGAGFTMGALTKKGNAVPSGKEFKKYMIKKIVKMQTDISEDELEKEAFSSVAEVFERSYSDIKNMGVSDYFSDHFTDVKIKNVNQLRFLNEIDWQYMYTLNIDTGIENSNRNRWEVFYPNKNFDENQRFEGRKKLYKIHGDANIFIKTLDYNEMILTESQYIASLSENKRFHDMLSADCENKNIIYIGCSLDDEIDIRYSVLSDKNRNFKEKETYRIYVTAEPLSSLKKVKLEGFNISHYIQLQTSDDYELFYEFLVQCFQESLLGAKQDIENFGYHQPRKLIKDTEKNIKYLADIKKNKEELPYYYFERELLGELHFSDEKINVIIGRRFSGKTLLAYNILEYFQNYTRYFITEQESIDTPTIRSLMECKKALIVFDSDCVDDKSLAEIRNSFKSQNKNIVCIFVNSYDDMVNALSYNDNEINQPLNHTLVGKLSDSDAEQLNEKLDNVGIAKFNKDRNILDNTLRIANLYGQNMISEYSIVSKEELEVIIWVLVQNKMYYEEIVFLGLSKHYNEIVKKFAPFLQIEKCKRSEMRKHSAIKIVGNGELGLLQILNNYVYPSDSNMGNTVAKNRYKYICDSIYHIIYSFNKIDQSIVKKFIMFDTLNDIFSRKYSQRSIDFLASEGQQGKNVQGASGLIQAIYSDEQIQQFKASDPNYWLQRAKSVDIINKKKVDAQQIYEGINWAIKAEQDAAILAGQEKNGNHHYRTMSNATIQTAIMYGRVARINNYAVIADNNRAVEYYYKGFSDSNNMAAARSLINNSRGTEDFNSLIKDIVSHPEHIDKEWGKERDYLINVSIKGDVIYSI